MLLYFWYFYLVLILNVSSRDWVDLVVSFPISPRSSKSEFVCKSYHCFGFSFLGIFSRAKHSLYTSYTPSHQKKRAKFR